jgi:beta-aspartyl-peptidase (threonine type)
MGQWFAASMLRPALIVHGGAGGADPELSAAHHAGCTAAVRAGWQVLSCGGSALDAVCEAVAVLEDAPAFNAGVGSCLTSSGSVEMDATVMEGSVLRAGAVTVVGTVRNPVRLARAIMEDGRHVFLAGPAAEAFARIHGVATCTPQELVTERQLQRWQQRDTAASETSGGTVGAAAVDRVGHVAAATSTGGIFCKLPGRVGDSAVIGAGTYADDALGAASATGHGEAIMRVVLAKSVVDWLRDGSEPARAAHQGIMALHRRVAGRGGIVIVDSLGRLGHACNTSHMTVGYMRPDLSGYVVQT